MAVSLGGNGVRGAKDEEVWIEEEEKEDDDEEEDEEEEEEEEEDEDEDVPDGKWRTRDELEVWLVTATFVKVAFEKVDTCVMLVSDVRLVCSKLELDELENDSMTVELKNSVTGDGSG